MISMNYLKVCLGAVLSLALLTGVARANDKSEKEKQRLKEEQLKNGGAKPPGSAPSQRPPQNPAQTRPWTARTTSERPNQVQPQRSPQERTNPTQPRRDVQAFPVEHREKPASDPFKTRESEKPRNNPARAERDNPARTERSDPPKNNSIERGDRSNGPAKAGNASTRQGSKPNSDRGNDKAAPRNERVEKPAGDPGSPEPRNQNRQNNERSGQKKAQSDTPKPALVTKATADGGHVKTTKSGQVREKVEKRQDGQHIQQFSPTGRPQREIVEKSDGTQHTKNFAADGKTVRQEVVRKSDGSREVINHQVGRNGQVRAQETIKVDQKGRQVSKTVVVKQNIVIANHTTIVNNTTVVKNYDRGRFGFVYHPPVYVVDAPVFVSWSYNYRPFHYTWGWNDYGWYHSHRTYWATYEVYPAPSYWVTDWVIASYVADRYAVSVSLAQAQEDLRIAREDAEQARLAAERAKEDAELAEARASQREAEAKLAKAEAKIAKMEANEARAKSQGTAQNTNARPIDSETKEALRTQIEQTVAERKEMAAKGANGETAVPDLSKSLADPKHIYPVSSSINVMLADGTAGGTLTEGDLLKLEPGQADILKDADENTLVNLRVVTSKGDEDEVKAGSVITLPLRTLQDFDSEFRAKLDLGLAEADKNQEEFKKGGI
jgi:hypothetical protein